MEKENQKLNSICPRCCSWEVFRKIMNGKIKGFVCYECRKKSIAVKPQQAHSKIALAKKRKLIKSLPCVVCGFLKTEGHHENYNKPLEVIWLCKKHHVERHQELKQLRKSHKKLNQSKIISSLILSK